MKNPPANLGKKWSDEEVQSLLQAIKRGETQSQIAEKHQRTVGGIVARLRQLAADYYYNDNRPIEEIMKFTGLDDETIADAISRRQWQMDQKEKILEKQQTIPQMIQQQEVKKEGMISLLTEIRDMMKEILEIMKERN